MMTPAASTGAILAACDKAKVPRATLNDLRRTFATLQARGGVAREDLVHFMGHVDDTMLRRIYDQTDEDDHVRARAGYFTDPRETRELRAVSCGPSIVVMEATEHWEGHDVPLGTALCGDRGLLVHPLVRAFDFDFSAERKKMRARYLALGSPGFCQLTTHPFSVMEGLCSWTLPASTPRSAGSPGSTASSLPNASDTR
jgi:hypothetical protein